MKPLSHPGFRNLVIGQTVSALGDWMATFALMVLVLHLSNSSTAVAFVLVLRLVPAMIGGAIAARVIRRWDRRRTMLFMDALRAGVVVLVPMVRAVWWVYLWAFVLEVLSLVFLPARDSVVPDLVEADELPTANGIVLASSYGTIPFGAAAFAAVAAISSVGGRFPLLAVFAVDALTFVVSYVFIRQVQIVGRQTAARTGERNPSQQLTLRGAFRIPLVHAVLPAVIVISLGLGTLFSLGIVFVRDVLDAGDVAFGLLIALFGVGAGIGLTVLGKLRRLPAVTTIRWGTAAQGITIAVISVSPSIVPAFAGAASLGASTWAQSCTPEPPSS